MSSAWAVQLTEVALGLSGAQIGQKARLLARMAPRTVTEGTVTFTSDGAVVAGCEAVPVRSGDAECMTEFPKLGRYLIGARYSGTPQWAPSFHQDYLTVGKLAPSVYVAVSPDSTIYGRGLFLNALVLGADGMPKPSGTVTFRDKGAVLVTRPLVQADGSAALGMNLPVGDHEVVVYYNGDAYYLPSRSEPVQFTVTKGPPILAISSTPAQLAQPVMMSASVTGSNPKGTITFDGFPLCADLKLDAAGFAHCKTSFGKLGEYPVTATYSGDQNFAPTSATMKVVVAKAVAGMYTANAPGAPVYGQRIEVNSLLIAAPGLPAPSGVAVHISDDSPSRKLSVPLDPGGHATWTGTLPAGLRRVTVSYDGDANYQPASAWTTFVVGRAETVTKLSAPAGGPFTATVNPLPPGGGVPAGSVRFLRDGQLLATVPLSNGAARFVSSEVGTITAEYLGDNNYVASSSTNLASAPRALILLTSDRNPSNAGETVTFTAVVTPSPGTTVPTGRVRFSANGTPLGSVELVAGRAAVSTPLASGRHAIVAEYSGDALYDATSSTLTQVVSGAQAGMSLTASAPAAVFGQAVTFTAQMIEGGSGAVRFYDGGVAIGSAPIVSGAASFTVASLAAGGHTITATWAGDASNGAANAELLLTVSRAPTATTLTLGTGAATVRVAAAPPGGGTPSGTVQVVDAETQELLVTGVLNGGSATVVLPRSGGSLAAVYTGDANFLESASNSATALAVVNSASYEGETVAPDEIVTLFGPIPEGLIEVQVTDRAGATRKAQVLHSATGQAAIVLPSGLAAGAATVTAGEYRAVVTVAPVAPGLFTADSSGKGSPAGVTAPVEIGDVGLPLVLYGTGFRHGTKFACTVAGRTVEVVYAGAQGEFPGLDQLNVLLPVALRGTGSAVVEFKADGVAANAVVLTIR